MKLRFLSTLMVVAFVSFGALAQDQGDIRANAGLTYIFSPFGDSDESRLGYGFGAEYFVIDALSLAPSYYLSNKDDLKLNILNIDVRYFFLTDGTQVYAVAGYQSATAKIGSFSDTNGGFALGAGAMFGISDALFINAELKYSLIKPDGADDPLGLLANAGVAYKF